MNKDVQRELDTAIDILRAAGASEVYLFGSFADDTATPDSDIDLAVKGLPPPVFFETVGKISLALSRNFDLIDMDEKNPFTEYLEQKRKLVRVA